MALVLTLRLISDLIKFYFKTKFSHNIFGDIMSRLKELRKEKGYTQIKLQHLTGIDQSDYSKLESGKRYFTYEQMPQISYSA